MADFQRMILSGTIRDSHEKFPIRFDYSENGNAFFIGGRVWSEIELHNGQKINKGMDVRAFGEIAEQMAHLVDGARVQLAGEFGKRKSNDGNYYDIVTVDEVIEA